MKLHSVNFLIAVAVSALVAYGLWSIDGGLKNFVAAGSFVFLAGTLVPCMGIDYERARRSTNLRVVCAVFFVLGLLVNVVFSFVGTSQTIYIIGNAIPFLLYILLASAVYNAKQ